MKVILIAGGAHSPARGVYAISHHLRKHGIETVVFDFFDKWSIAQVVKTAKKYVQDGDIVGFSNTFFTADFIKHANLFYYATRSVDCTFVLGGENYNRGIRCDVELCAIGYAEDQFLDFVNMKFKRIRKIPYMFETDDFTWYEDYGFAERTSLPVELSRNCIFNCKFCSFPNRGMRMPYRNMQLVRNELDTANRLWGTTKFSIVCSTFNDSEEKMNDFFDAIDGTNYEFFAFIRLELLMKQKHLWPKIRKHITHISFGIETLNWESGKAIGKASHPEKVKSWLKEVHEYFNEIIVGSGFIIGLPKSTIVDDEAVQSFMEETKYLDWYLYFALFIDVENGNSRSFTSDFEKNHTKHGYSAYGVGGWIRDDGYSVDDAFHDADRLNRLRNCTPSSFRTISMASDMSIAEIKNTRVKSDPTGLCLIPKEAFVIEDRIRNQYLVNRGIAQ